MWNKIGLLGRDKLLKSEIYPRVLRKKPPFLLSGPRGIGKTALLQWGYEQADGIKAYISASAPVKDCLIAIVKGWGLQELVQRDGKQVAPERALVSDLERTIMASDGGLIFVDDLHAARPVFLRKLKVWRERFIVFAAGVPPFSSEQLRRSIWGLKQLHITPIPRNERLRMARAFCSVTASIGSPEQIAHAARGYPARMVAGALGEIEDATPRVEGEEINIAPVLLFVLAGIVALRYIGMAVDETSLYVMGGLGMAFALIFRFFLFKGMGK